MDADFLSLLVFRRAVRLVLVFGAPFFLAGCAQSFALHRVDPLRVGAREFSSQQLVQAGIHAQGSGRNQEAAGFYLDALEKLDSHSYRQHDGTAAARNYITARLVEICAPPLLLPNAPPLIVTGPRGRRYKVTLCRGIGQGGIEPRMFISLHPTDRYSVTRVPGDNGLRAGTGAPLVGQLPPITPPQKTERPTKPIAGVCWSATAVAVLGPSEKTGRSVALEIFEPHDVENIASPFTRHEPLAADFTTPGALTRTSTKRHGFAIAGFLRGDEYFGNAGLYPTEIPTPDKTPVVLVHGLISDPSVYRYLSHAIETDPDLRRRYQLWYFFYPTGLPVVTSAAILRDALRKKIARLDPDRSHPALHQAVLVGHSMGGLVSRLNVTDSEGDKFYRFYFRKPFEQLKLSPESREKTRAAMFFRASPDVRTVVFIATPHRGSELARSLVGSLGRALVSLPHAMSRHLREITSENAGATAKTNLRDESSVFNLKPDSTLVRALAALPIRASRVYTIVGNRGRPGPVAESSDGVVPYRSAHLPQALRETVVPANHYSELETPNTIAEVKCILRNDEPMPGAPRYRTSGEYARQMVSNVKENRQP